MQAMRIAVIFIVAAQVFAACPQAAPLVPTEPALEVSTSAELSAAINAANAGGRKHIVLAPGDYRVAGRGYVLRANNITIRGKTGNRADVVIRGDGHRGTATHGFLVWGKDVTIRDLSIGWVKHHAIQIAGERDADRPVLYNLRIADTGQQLVKVSGAYTPQVSNNGRVSACLFEFTKGVAFQFYTGGIDAHSTVDWEVTDNEFRNIRSPEARLAEHAIHFWSGAKNTLVARNRIFNSDRGIGFGLGQRGHRGGIIRNNFVHTTRDVGIGLESSPNTTVAHNTVVISSYANAIEYRFKRTRDVKIVANLVNKRVQKRQGGSAQLARNITNAAPYWFVNAGRGDLHLTPTLQLELTRTPSGIGITDDIDCQARGTGLTHVGADHKD